MGCVFAYVTSIHQEYLFIKFWSFVCLFVFMTQRSPPNAVLKKTVMSFLGCWFGKGPSFNHTVYRLNGRDGILNGIFFKFHFLPKRNASHQQLIRTDFSVSSHHLFGGLNSAKNVGNFLRFSSYFEGRFLWGRRTVMNIGCVSWFSAGELVSTRFS